MVARTEPIEATKKQLTQVGMNAMLWRLIEDAGGELTFPADSLLLDNGSVFDVVHDPKTNMFTIKTVVLKPKAIIEPEKRLIIPE